MNLEVWRFSSQEDSTNGALFVYENNERKFCEYNITMDFFHWRSFKRLEPKLNLGTKFGIC